MRPDPIEGRGRLGPGGTLLAAAMLLAIIGTYMILNREAVAGPAGRVLDALAGAPPEVSR